MVRPYNSMSFWPQSTRQAQRWRRVVLGIRCSTITPLSQAPFGSSPISVSRSGK